MVPSLRYIPCPIVVPSPSSKVPGPAFVMSIVADGDIAFRSDAHERRQYNVAGIAPQLDAPLDDAELQRAEVPLVIVLAAFREVAQNIAFVYAVGMLAA